MFGTFWLRNVLRATTACNFSSLIWPDGSAPAALGSLLFEPLEPQIIEKMQCFTTVLPFRAPASSFFWLFLFSYLLSSSLVFSSRTLPTSVFSSVHIFGSLTSKLLSLNTHIYIRTHTYTHRHIHTYTRTCIHTYAYIHTHTHIHTYIHSITVDTEGINQQRAIASFVGGEGTQVSPGPDIYIYYILYTIYYIIYYIYTLYTIHILYISILHYIYNIYIYILIVIDVQHQGILLLLRSYTHTQTHTQNHMEMHPSKHEQTGSPIFLCDIESLQQCWKPWAEEQKRYRHTVSVSASFSRSLSLLLSLSGGGGSGGRCCCCGGGGACGFGCCCSSRE